MIASVEDTLGLPSPHELGQGEGGGGGGGGGEGAEFDDETSKLAEGGSTSSRGGGWRFIIVAFPFRDGGARCTTRRPPPSHTRRAPLW